VKRFAILVVLGALAAAQGNTGRGIADPEFEKIPFQQWLSGDGQTQMHWTARVFPPILSSQQRLLAGIELQFDGAELARRRGHGQWMIFIQLTDDEGATYQDHGSIDLEKVEEGISASLNASNVTYTQYVFVRPGDYHIACAIYDTATGEHAIRTDTLHVAGLKKDPLPGAWRDLPPVEFRPNAEAPDIYYLPSLTGRLRLPLETRRPVRMEVIVNLTPSELASGSLRAQGRNLSTLLPALKVIAQIGSGDDTKNFALLDLARRRVAFHQEQVREPDWDRMKAALTENDPGTIDVKSLQDRKHNAGFFVSEVGRRINADAEKPAAGTAAPLRVLIVITSPVAFEPGEDLQPVRPETASGYRVYYLRLHAATQRPYAVGIPERTRGFGPGMGRHRHANPDEEAARADQIDQLASTVKPLSPRLFDISTAQDFRKALAAILSDISRQ
jgi:hypothetical protein